MFRKSLFEPTLFDQSVGEITTETEEYMFASLDKPLNQVRPDDSLREPKQHEIDPSYNAVVAMQVNHPEFALWCENELHLMGITREQIYDWHMKSSRGNQAAEFRSLLRARSATSIYSKSIREEKKVQHNNLKAVRQFGKYAEVHFNKSVHFPLYKGLADATLRCIPTAKLLKEMDLHSTIFGEEYLKNRRKL